MKLPLRVVGNCDGWSHYILTFIDLIINGFMKKRPKLINDP